MAATPSAEGIDLASFQGKPDWSKVAGAGIGFAIAKRSQGVRYLNPTYDFDRVGAVSHKLRFGAYHFAEAGHGHSGHAEAAHFLTRLHAEPWHLLPTLDLEEVGSEGATPPQLEAFAVDFGLYVTRQLGVSRLILYTDRNMLEHRVRVTQRLRQLYLLWLADLSPAPHHPAGWSLVLWQYGWHGRVPGVAGQVDRDRALVPLDHLTIEHYANR